MIKQIPIMNLIRQLISSNRLKSIIDGNNQLVINQFTKWLRLWSWFSICYQNHDIYTLDGQTGKVLLIDKGHNMFHHPKLRGQSLNNQQDQRHPRHVSTSLLTAAISRWSDKNGWKSIAEIEFRTWFRFLNFHGIIRKWNYLFWIEMIDSMLKIDGNFISTIIFRNKHIWIQLTIRSLMDFIFNTENEKLPVETWWR